jgi:hypothetical protein
MQKSKAVVRGDLVPGRAGRVDRWGESPEWPTRRITGAGVRGLRDLTTESRPGPVRCLRQCS